MKDLLANASNGPIPFKDAELVFDNIMDGNLSEIEIASFLTSLKVRGESIDELTAAASIMRKKSLKVFIDLFNSQILICKVASSNCILKIKKA